MLNVDISRLPAKDDCGKPVQGGGCDYKHKKSTNGLELAELETSELSKQEMKRSSASSAYSYCFFGRISGSMADW